MRQRVVVGMSGGVDSSVTAALLQAQGYEVLGLFMDNWKGQIAGQCHAAADYQDALMVAQLLQIPLYSVDFSQAYFDKVFTRCLTEFKQGRTPNPDIWCNQEIKFALFFQKAMELGADYMATGHYARLLEYQGTTLLAKACDLSKDQSYFLYAMERTAVPRVLFPLGTWDKSQVRAYARTLQLPTADKKDSVGICFIGKKKKFLDFLKEYIPAEPGEIHDLHGRKLGMHEGVYYYTIGQRKGLQLGGAKEPWFVVGKDIERRIVYVDTQTSEALHASSIVVSDVTWWLEPLFPLHCRAKIRYRSADVACHVHADNNGLVVEFDTPQKAVTPGQSIVFYQEHYCLGGGIIVERNS